MYTNPSSSDNMLSLNDICLSQRTAAWTYLPCNSMSTTHDLICGHRITSSIDESCASNCIHPLQPVFTPFICRACITQSILSGLGFASDTDFLSTWGQDTLETNMVSGIVHSLIEDAVLVELDEEHRDATPIPKTGGIAQFVAENGRSVLRIVANELVAVEEAFWGLKITTAEEQVDVMEQVLASLGLGENKEGERKGDVEEWFR